MITRKLGKYNGRAVYSWRGILEVQGGRPIEVAVVSDDPREAAALLYEDAMRLCAPRLIPFEITIFGVKGGQAAHRYAGYESVIGWEMMFGRRGTNQLGLGLVDARKLRENGGVE